MGHDFYLKWTTNTLLHRSNMEIEGANRFLDINHWRKDIMKDAVNSKSNKEY